MIESCLLPFLKIRLNVLRIAEGTTDNRDVGDLSLGQAIAELAATDRALYSPAPFDIPLSQWRNIAFHGNYDVRGRRIRCQYGNRRLHRFECTPTQLLDVMKYTNDVYYVHKVAYEIFGIDNTDRVLQVRKASGDSRVVHDFDFDFNTYTILAYSIVASGFRILNAGRRGVRWMLLLEDLHGCTKADIKRTLKEALISYMVHVNFLHLQALIRSRGTSHRLSFRAEMRSSKVELLPGEHSAYAIGKNFRVDDSSGD